ncbi:hypothetical protein RF11_07720 [Thelohanellus kitauei]|uniref:Uncharacterized protein n=1 Tax=Thelohanellus kitauei TaxID=669202 RepID=A0A0C2N070_THEKT|nr:hypothetical protein RF11_07720 [Thelohanellus kitauei]
MRKKRWKLPNIGVTINRGVSKLLGRKNDQKPEGEEKVSRPLPIPPPDTYIDPNGPNPSEEDDNYEPIWQFKRAEQNIPENEDVDYEVPLTRTPRDEPQPKDKTNGDETSVVLPPLTSSDSKQLSERGDTNQESGQKETQSIEVLRGRYIVRHARNVFQANECGFITVALVSGESCTSRFSMYRWVLSHSAMPEVIVHVKNI